MGIQKELIKHTNNLIKKNIPDYVKDYIKTVSDFNDHYSFIVSDFEEDIFRMSYYFNKAEDKFLNISLFLIVVNLIKDDIDISYYVCSYVYRGKDLPFKESFMKFIVMQKLNRKLLFEEIIKYSSMYDILILMNIKFNCIKELYIKYNKLIDKYNIVVKEDVSFRDLKIMKLI